MHREIPHNFTRKEAVNRIKMALNQSRGQLLQQAPDLKTDWKADTILFSATIQGKHITGTLEVQEKQFVLDAKLPLLWRLFEGKIEKAIKEQVAQLG
jgi:hypothetical protein